MLARAALSRGLEAHGPFTSMPDGYASKDGVKLGIPDRTHALRQAIQRVPQKAGTVL